MGRTSSGRCSAVLVGIALTVLFAGACSGASDPPPPSTTTLPPETTTTTSVPIEAGDQRFVYIPEEGDCYDRRFVERSSGGAQTPIVLVVDCSLPHRYEVFAVHPPPTTGTAYPEDDVLRSFARSTCVRSFEAYVGAPYELSELDIDYFIPSRTEWAEGARLIGCTLFDTSGEPLVGVAAGSGR